MVQVRRSEGVLGAKSQIAAGLEVMEVRIWMVAERDAPQQMKPMPMGRILGGVLGMGEVSREEMISWSKEDRVETSVPAPRNPRPWERETDNVREEVEIRRMGAETMRGWVWEVHG